MNVDRIKHIQSVVGTEVDGFWGPLSIAACKRHLESLMPYENPWPQSDEKSLRAFYGEPGDRENLVYIDALEWMRLYNSEKRVKHIRCHRKVADSLLRALEAAYLVAPEVVSRYFGCFNYRKMRNGSRLSTHAWGISIDLDAFRNGNLTAWPQGAFMPIEVMECFAREGWKPAGAFWGRDAMHFQATQ